MFIQISADRKMMKYIILFMFCTLLMSCSEDTLPNGGKGNNVVVGVWNNYYDDTDSLVMTRVFSPDYYSYFTFADGKNYEALNKQKYIISDTELKLDSFTQKYRLDNDTLWITNSSGDQITRYVKVAGQVVNVFRTK